VHAQASAKPNSPAPARSHALAQAAKITLLTAANEADVRKNRSRFFPMD